jgi:hypothetical protein
MPDALSKTVPIWCAVMNRFLFPDMKESHILRTPPEVVGRSEHSQIEARLDDFLKGLTVRTIYTQTAVMPVLRKPNRTSILTSRD